MATSNKQININARIIIKLVILLLLVSIDYSIIKFTLIETYEETAYNALPAKLTRLESSMNNSDYMRLIEEMHLSQGTDEELTPYWQFVSAYEQSEYAKMWVRLAETDTEDSAVYREKAETARKNFESIVSSCTDPKVQNKMKTLLK